MISGNFIGVDVNGTEGIGNYHGGVWIKDGDTDFRLTLPTVVPAVEYIAATATDAGNNTSEFSACCRLCTNPGPGIKILIEDVDKLVDAGTLNPGQGNALSVKLEGVLKKLESGNTKAASNQLGAFINQVNAMITSGILASEEGQPLIDLAQRVMASIQVSGASIDLTSQNEETGAGSLFLPAINR